MRLKAPLLLVLLPGLCLAGDDPCASLLSVLNRPTVADSVCSVKAGQIIIEGGYEYQYTYPRHGEQNNFPEIDLRFGLPGSNEVSAVLPNYSSSNGFSATVLEAKHQFNPNGKWVYAVEGLLTLPTGSDENGSDGFGFTANGIVNYSATEALSFAVMLGLSTQTTSSDAGGGRYESFNPDLVITWQFNENFQTYVEFYGQTKTAPDQSSGYNADAGLQYLPTKNIELDIEYGQRLSGELGGFARYIGAGGGMRF